MHLKRLRVSNFKALEKIDVEFDSLVSVIIGPNAVGKTTVLEAIRLAKAILAPRTPHESNQILNALGATSPHMPQRLFPNAFTNKPSIPLSIKCTYDLIQSEIDSVKKIQPQLAARVAQQNAGLSFDNPSQSIAFLSSPHGRSALTQAAKDLTVEVAALETRRTLELNLTIDFEAGQISGEFPIQQVFFVALEQALDPRKSLFSYFPADRAMPTGEQPVQLGAADTTNQLESYNSQPQLKYQRLKHTIFSSIIGGATGRTDLTAHFKLIFDRILKGRELGEIGLNQIGMLSIPIIDKDTGVFFEIDSLSSGEKGLLLTFLLIAVSIEKNGMILLDEPELHLNPAVCHDLLQFFVDEYAMKLNVQGIICSHSAEILAGVFERPACSLYHLKGGKSLAKVRHNDQGEIRDALRRLGSSESEALLFRGTVSVEGIHDTEILMAGFEDILRRYKIKQRGGRNEIEKDIKELQEGEKKGEEIGYHYFIFDHDRKPTSLMDSEHVKLLQLGRYCLENYLLDVDILTDVTRNPDFSNNPKKTTTDMRDAMKGLAMAQLSEVVSRKIFKDLSLEAVGFDMSIMRSVDAAEVADSLWQQIVRLISELRRHDTADFVEQFTEKFKQGMAADSPIWDEKWRELCSGKQLFEDLRRTGHLKGDLLKIKKSIMLQMRSKKTEAYSSLEGLIRDLVT